MSISEKKKAVLIEKMRLSSDGSLEQFYNVFFGSNRPPLMHSEIGWQPAADMYETENHVVIIVEIAGISTKDVSLTLDKDTLILRGIRREIHNDEKRQYYEMEISFGPFERVFHLQSPVCCDKVRAQYEEGFLIIRFRKRSKIQKKKTIIKIN